MSAAENEIKKLSGKRPYILEILEPTEVNRCDLRCFQNLASLPIDLLFKQRYTA
jgi:hypothetical protein